MANQQNPGTGQTQQQTTDVREALKNILKLQGDYRDILKESIKDLNSTLKSYDKMEAKLATINRSAINTKEVQQQIKKVEEDRYLNTKKLADLDKSLSANQKQASSSYLNALERRNSLEQKMLKAQKNGNQALLTRTQNILNNLNQRIEREEESLNVEQLAYVQSLQTDKLNQELLDKQKQQLEIEKKLRSNIGYTGATFKLFADKLGLGNQYYEEMVESARRLNDEGKKPGFLDKLGVLGKAASGGVMEALSDPLTAIPIAGVAIAGLVKGLVSAFNYVVDITSETTKFGRQLGLSNLEARKLNTEFNVYSITQGSILANARSMYESQIELGKALGVNNVLSKEILDTNIQLKDIAGLDEQARASIAESATITGKSSKDTLKSVLAQVEGLKQATGVSLNYQEVLGEASKLGGFLGLSFAKYPAQLAKSLVTVKAMGMNLKELDSMASSFLDFESSISKEFEAQLLTGRSINLSKARELFLNNDLAGAASEINSQVGSSADFMKMNRIQAESFAEALGMTRDQMGEMLKRQELLSKLGAKDTDNAQKQYQLALKRFGTQKEMTAALGQEAVQSMLNASNQEKIAGLMDKIKSAFADFVQNSPIVPMIERMIDWVSKPGNIMKIVEAIKNTMATVFDIVGNIAAAIMSAANFFGAGIDENLIRSAKMGGSVLKSIDFGSMAGQVGSASIGSNAQTQTSTTGGNNAIEKTKSAIVVENNTTTYLNLDSARIATDVGTGKISKAIQ